MKKIGLLILWFAGKNFTQAQFVISPGAIVHITGNAQLTLSNMDFINNGNFTPGNGTVFFTGNTSSVIRGSQPTQFYGIEINKSAGATLTLQRSINVSQQINFVNGFLALNNFNTDLGTTGVLVNEQESSRITGANGGKVLFTTTLNAPSASNPGNLGAIFTSAQNLGIVSIQRGHQSQVNGAGMGNSVLRYFDISPSANTSLNATLRFQYFDAELNGLDENTLQFWKSINTTNWTNEGFTSRNSINNYVEKTGISSFSRWTLSSIGNPLPVSFIYFNVQCNTSGILLNWKTASEQNSSHFNIEKSNDGMTWTVIGNLPAAGNSSIEKSYAFTDNNIVQQSFYRLAQYDLDGRVHYSSVIRSKCMEPTTLKVWPNPATERVFISVAATSTKQLNLHLYNAAGALIKKQNRGLLPGTNIITINLVGLSSGIYMLHMNDGQKSFIATLIKQ